MIATPKTLAFIAAFAVLFVCAAPVSAGTAPAKTEARPYQEILLDGKNSDPAAVAIVTKALATDISELKQIIPQDPKIVAQFIALGPDRPKTSVVAMIDHPGVCGASGCEVVILEPGAKKNSYRKVFDTTLGRLFISTRPGKAYSDFLAIVMPRASDGFGVWFWNDKKREYQFAGVSKFSKQ